MFFQCRCFFGGGGLELSERCVRESERETRKDGGRNVRDGFFEFEGVCDFLK